MKYEKILDDFIKKKYAKRMTNRLEEIVDAHLKLTGKKRETFLRQAEALRANIKLRQKQQKERKKCMPSK